MEGYPKIRFLDNGKRTGAAKRRVKLFWDRRCSAEIEIIVLPTDIFNMFAEGIWPPLARGHSTGFAYKKYETFVVPTETLRQHYWQRVLEHELLHLEHREWTEAQTEQEAVANVKANPLGFLEL